MFKLAVEEVSGSVCTVQTAGFVAEPPVMEGRIPGSWTSCRGWTSLSGSEVPIGIQVGRYTIEAHSKRSVRPLRVPFHVIYNPKI